MENPVVDKTLPSLEQSPDRSPPLVSVLVKNYNCQSYVQQAIDSVESQTYPNIEIVIIDDGSTDSSRQVIDSCSTSSNRPFVKVYKANGGEASALNAGFAASRGDLICILDSDDLFLPEKVAAVVDIFERASDIHWCFHDLRWIDANAELLPALSTQRSPSKSDLRERLRSGKLPPALPASSALSFRRSLLKEIFPLPVAQAIRTSDLYIKYAAAALSKGYFAGQVLALHRIHSNNAATFRPNIDNLKARKLIYTGTWISQELTGFKKFANKLVGAGIGLNLKAGDRDPQNTQAIQAYLSNCSTRDRLKVRSIGLGYYVKENLKRN